MAPTPAGRARQTAAGLALLGPLVDEADPGTARPSHVIELTTVSDDEAAFHDGTRVVTYDGLTPDTAYEFEGIAFRTLARPGCERLATITTVNDVHFGETECGVLEGFEVGPILRAEPGEPPYPETMNRGAIVEMAAIGPDAVVVKGDLTTNGTTEEYAEFLDYYGDAFGARLHHVRGNHDGYYGADFASDAPIEVTLPGVTLAILDTVVLRSATGQVSAAQLDWLDELGARADRPVLVFGHHHIWAPGSRARPETYFGVNCDDSEKLVDVFARRRLLVGYFAGHTHRNRVRRFAATGDRPWVEVACVKDFPGSWAEYRVFDGGILQVHRRISTPEALDWSDRCRAMFAGAYVDYAFGRLEDRCLAIETEGLD